jgi:uncharacterized membrane protein YphA (DoxX/SURF4 family)
VAEKVILLALRVALAWVFIHAGILKIWDFSHGRSATPDFTLAIQHFEMLTPDLSMLLALYLPWLEVFAALALFIRRLALGALTAIVGMTAVFIAALASAWSRGLDISCGCFGKDEVSTDFPTLLLRDTCILAGAAILFALEWRKAASDPVHPANPENPVQKARQD